MKQYLQKRKKMDSKFFIEIGVSDFNTLEQLLNNGWKGLMVEPYDLVYNRLPNHPNLTKEKVAIDTKNGFADFWIVEDVDIWQNSQEVVGMSCLVDSPGALHEPVYEGRKKTLQVQTIRLDSLLEKHRVSRIDLLKIDAEGKDVEILLDYSFIIKPNVIKFEHIHYSGKEYNASAVGFDQLTMTKKYNFLLEKLKSIGYIIWEENNDVYCVL